MNSISPKPLKSGDTVHIISTARKVDCDFIEDAKVRLESMGLKVVFGANLFAESDQFAGDDTARVSDLNAAIQDESCRAIFCARGGYGTVRLLDQIDLQTLRRDPKWIVGYSDVTALLNHVFNTTGIQGIHGTMPVNYASNSNDSLSTLFDLLFAKDVAYRFERHPMNIDGVAAGNLVGGNLSVIYSLLGSESALTGENQILFLEDLDEYLYHIDRMIMALKRSGLLRRIKGLVVGGMSDMHDNAIPFGQNAYEIILSQCSELGIPVCFGFDSGHLDKNLAWVHGKKIRLTVKNGQPVQIDYLS